MRTAVNGIASCVRHDDIIGGLDERRLVNAPMVAVDSVTSTNLMGASEDFVTYLSTMVATVA